VAKAVLFRGFDWANLFVCLPIAVYGIVLHQRGRLRGTLLVAAVFTYLAYNYLIGVMGNAFNEMFFAWTALFSVGVFGLATTIAILNLPSIPRHMSTRFPRRSLSVYLVVLGLFLMVQYLTEILGSYSTGSPPPSLGVYTTLELAALELGIMIPLHFVAAALLLKRRPAGFLLGALLVFTALMTFVSLLVGAFISWSAYRLGGVPDMVVPMVLTLVAAGFSVAVFAAVSGQPASEPAIERGHRAERQKLE
jgi:hypothetical protein